MEKIVGLVMVLFLVGCWQSANGECEYDTDSDTIGSSDTGEDTDTGSEVDTGSDADSDSDGDSDTGTGSDTGEDTDTGSEVDTGSDADSDSDGDSDTGTGSDTGEDTDTGSEVDTGSDTDTASAYAGWCAEGGSGGHTGDSSAELSENLDLAWSASVGTTVWYSPVVDADGNIFVATEDLEASTDTARVVSFTAAGEFRWEFEYDAYYGFSREPVLDDNGHLYASGALTNTVYALDAETGALLWSHDFFDHYVEEMVPFTSGVIVRYLGGMKAVSASGEVLWTYEDVGFNPKYHLTAGPDGEVYTANHDSVAKTVNGSVVWTTAVSPVARPALREDRLYVPVVVAEDAFTVQCLDAETGSVIWESSSVTVADGQPGPSGISIAGKFVYFGVNNVVKMISRGDGSDFKGFVLGVSDGNTFAAPVVDRTGKIAAIRGNTLFLQYAEDAYAQAVVEDNSTAYDGIIPTPMAIGKDGEIIVGTKSGQLYVFH